MSSRTHPDESGVELVKQVTERDRQVKQVAAINPRHRNDEGSSKLTSQDRVAEFASGRRT